MAGPRRYFGRRVTAPERDIAHISANQQLGYVANPAPADTIVYRLGGWVGKNGGTNATVRFALHDTSGLEPGAILASTGAVTASTTYTDITGGSAVVANLTAPYVVGAYNYGLSVATTQPLSSSMREAAAISGDNERFYRRSAPSGTPQSLAGVTGTNEGHLSLWAEGEPSVKPNTPTNLSPAGTSSGTGLTPTLTSDFSDPNETLNNGVAWDYLNRYQIRVVRAVDGAVMWSAIYSASTSERTNRRTSRPYAGAALAYNTTYTYLIRHEDRTGKWSSWASSSFVITSLSTVDRPSSPSGFITNRANPGNITAVYRHNAGVAANAMQARLLSSSGAVIATSNSIAVSVPANGTLSMTWAQSGFASVVQDGGDYRVQVRARDANNQWSPDWSPARAFRLNAAPHTPTGLSPAGDRASGTRPLLTLQASDPDPEHGPPLPQVFAEILDESNTVLQTRQMSWVSARSRYEYQTTSVDLPDYGAYRWRAYSYDGFLYSGGATTAAGATRSAVASFVYAEVPAVTITGPASPIATTTPVIEWESVNQTHYRIRLYHPVTDALVYDSGTVASSAQSAPITAGGWLGGEKWNTGETFNAVVSVTDTTTLTGDSEPFPILLEYDPPATLDAVAYLHTLAGTHGTNAVRVEWMQTSYPSDEFAAYVVERTELLADGLTERPGTTVRLAEIDDPGSTVLLDAEVTSRQLYRYDVSQRVIQGNDILQSPATSVTAVVEFDGVLLHCPVDPEALHVALRYGPPDGGWEPALAYGQPMRTESPVGQGGRVVFFGRGQTHDPSGTFGLVSDRFSTADEKRDALDLIHEAQGGEWDGRPHIVCWRDGRGGKHGRLYGAVAGLNRVHAIAGGYVVELEFTEAEFALGVEEASS